MASLLKQTMGLETRAAKALRSRVRDMPGGFGSSRPLPAQSPPKISTPIPRAHSQLANKSVLSGLSAGMAASGTAMGAVGGGGMGAIFGNKEGTLGGAQRGAMRGAFAGAVGGAMMGVGLPAAARYGTSNNKFMSNAGGWTDNLTKMSGALNTSEGRSAMFAGGGLLGGFAFGGSGQGSKKRGFNRNRGNSISSRGY